MSVFDGYEFKLKCNPEDAELALKLLKEFFNKYPENKSGIIQQYGKAFYVYKTKKSYVARFNK